MVTIDAETANTLEELKKRFPEHGAGKTLPWPSGKSPAEVVDRVRLVVVEGPSAGHAFVSSKHRFVIGSAPVADLVVDEPTVSRFHCEILIEDGAQRIVDLGSRNGTTVDGVPISDAFLRTGSLIHCGRVKLRFEVCQEGALLPLSPRDQFGNLIGGSAAMRRVFALLERVAATDTTVLLEGETGTGKGAAAEAIHRASTRAKGGFVVVDCGAIPAHLLESELFGHERGAFTGATARRIGAFEEASGGTIFLDEVGELPSELQPKLLRVLENREIRRLGTNTMRAVDVRIIAATHRDLRAEVNAGRFRADLYFRLAVAPILIPALRSHAEDIPVIAMQVLARLGAKPDVIGRLLSPEMCQVLEHGAWPGNVRELRNYLERCLVFEDTPPVPAESFGRAHGGAAGATKDGDDGESETGLANLGYAEARAAALARFEKRYLRALLDMHGGKVSAAARAAGIDRVYLYRLLRRHGID